MERTLDVYLHAELVGHLIQDAHGRLAFSYSNAWLAKPDAVALSHSLPVKATRFTRNECRGFFAGVLPEAELRRIIAHNLGISPHNDFALLKHIGGECAGAVSFMPSGVPLLKQDANYQHLTEQELVNILKTLPRKPLLAGSDELRLSLAGAQDKLAVHLLNEVISLPLGGAASTHILKPPIKEFAGLVFNEALCMQLAAAVGIPTAHVAVRQVQGIDYLLVERYDRRFDKQQHIQRLHQEDFCQALGIAPELKYQNEGGPGLKACFDLLRTVSSKPGIDLQNLLDAVIFNVLIGNHDAHGKNFSLLYYDDDNIRLAPLYDVLSTAMYPELSQKMAMKIGGEYEFARLFPHHFERLANDAGLGSSLVKHRVTELADAVITELNKVTLSHSTTEEAAELICQRCGLVMQRFKKA